LRGVSGSIDIDYLFCYKLCRQKVEMKNLSLNQRRTNTLKEDIKKILESGPLESGPIDMILWILVIMGIFSLLTYSISTEHATTTIWLFASLILWAKYVVLKEEKGEIGILSHFALFILFFISIYLNGLESATVIFITIALISAVELYDDTKRVVLGILYGPIFVIGTATIMITVWMIELNISNFFSIFILLIYEGLTWVEQEKKEWCIQNPYR